MRRKIRRTILLSQEEAQLLERKAKAACLTQSALLRLYIQGFEPREKPDDRFYRAMDEISGMSDQVRLLSERIRAKDPEAAEKLKEEAVRWHRFQAEIEGAFLRPERSTIKWQS